MKETGYAVEIVRKDGSTFLSSGGIGCFPAIWLRRRNRRFAVEYKRDLIRHGFKCRVVEVEVSQPVVVSTNRSGIMRVGRPRRIP